MTQHDGNFRMDYKKPHGRPHVIRANLYKNHDIGAYIVDAG